MLYRGLLFFGLFLPFQFALNPTSGIDLAIIRVIIPLFFCFWLYGLKQGKYSLTTNRVFNYLLFGFFFLTALSFFLSTNFALSFRRFLFPLSIFPLFLVTASLLKSKKRQVTLVSYLLFGASLVALIGILQFLAQFIFGIDPVYNFWAKNLLPFFLGNSFSSAVLTYPSFLVSSNTHTYLRASSIFPDPHMFSYYLGMLFPWAIVLWQKAEKYNYLFLTAALILLLADLFSFTRGGYLALAAGAIIILPLVKRKAALNIVFSVVVLIFLVNLIPNSPVTSRFNSSFDTQEGSNVQRIANWKQALPIILSHPQGVGIGMYASTINPTATLREPIYAHNLYLDLAAELGIIAALVFVAMLAVALYFFWQKSQKDPFYLAGISSITIFAVHSLVENPLYSVHVLSLLLLILALAMTDTSHEKLSSLS